MIFSRVPRLLSRSSQTVWDLERRAIQKGRDPEPYIREKVQKWKYRHLPNQQQDVWKLHDRATADGYSSSEYFINKVLAAPHLYGRIEQKHLDNYRRLQTEKEALEVWKKTPIEYTEFYNESLRRTQASDETTSISCSDSMQVDPSSTTRLSEEKRPCLMSPRFPKRVSEEKPKKSLEQEEISPFKSVPQDTESENAFKKECFISEPLPSLHPSEAIPSSPKADSVKGNSQESLLLPTDKNKERRVSTIAPLPGEEAFMSSGLARQETDGSSILTKKSDSFWSKRSRTNDPYSSGNISSSASKTSLISTTLSQLSLGLGRQKTSTSLGLAENDGNFADPFIKPRAKDGKTAGFVGASAVRQKDKKQQPFPETGIMKTVVIKTEIEQL